MPFAKNAKAKPASLCALAAALNAMNESEYQRRVLEISKEILAANPSTTRQSALRHAKDIAKIRDSYKVASESKITNFSPTLWKDRPEHVKATIFRQRSAEQERKKMDEVCQKPDLQVAVKLAPNNLAAFNKALKFATGLWAFAGLQNAGAFRSHLACR